MLKESIQAADGVLIATSQYNFTLLGVFRGLIDWLSRVEDQPFKCKPVAVFSASAVPLDGTRAQYDLRKVLFPQRRYIDQARSFLGTAGSKFDVNSGECFDEMPCRVVGKQMVAFVKWIPAAQRMAR